MRQSFFVSFPHLPNWLFVSVLHGTTRHDNVPQRRKDAKSWTNQTTTTMTIMSQHTLNACYNITKRCCCCRRRRLICLFVNLWPRLSSQHYLGLPVSIYFCKYCHYYLLPIGTIEELSSYVSLVMVIALGKLMLYFPFNSIPCHDKSKAKISTNADSVNTMAKNFINFFQRLDASVSW